MYVAQFPSEISTNTVPTRGGTIIPREKKSIPIQMADRLRLVLLLLLLLVQRTDLLSKWLETRARGSKRQKNRSKIYRKQQSLLQQTEILISVRSECLVCTHLNWYVCTYAVCTILGLTFADAKNSTHGTLISIGHSTKKVFSFRLANTSKVSNRVVEMPTYCNRDSILITNYNFNYNLKL